MSTRDDLIVIAADAIERATWGRADHYVSRASKEMARRQAAAVIDALGIEQGWWETCSAAVNAGRLYAIDDDRHAGRCPDCRPVFRIRALESLVH